MATNFDPTKYGATPVSQNTGFDPSKYGATRVSSTAQQVKEPNLYEKIVQGGKAVGNFLGGNVIGETIGTGVGEAVVRGKEALGMLPKGTSQYYDTTTPTAKQLTGDVIKSATSIIPSTGIAGGVARMASKLPIVSKVAQGVGQTVTGGLYGYGQDVGTKLVNKEENALTPGLGTALGLGSTPAMKAVTSAVSKTASAVDKGVSGASRFAYSQASGLSPSSITDIVKNPSFFTPENLAKVSREDLASEVKSAIDQRIDSLKSTGSGYELIRKSNENVFVEPQRINSVFEKYGIKTTPDGDIVLSSESKPFSSSDITAIKDFFKVYGEPELSANGFLNAKEALSEMAKYGEGKTNNIKAFARDLRSAYDELGKTQLTGLKELDAQYAPEVQILSKIKKDYLNPDGSFKDNAVTKIANLGNRGRESVMERLKPIIPDIETRVRTLKVVEDIENSLGQKVGTYGRAAVTGGLALTGNVPLAIAGIILAYPKSSVAILRSIGYTREAIKKGVNVAKKWTGDISNPKTQKLGELLISEGKKTVEKWKKTKTK